ncbi:MAG: ComEA family DNA-binding protein [Candidatus Omnitrophica bacterium]|nr:ComEA family DNA-binding protein [Candidatus Omnitrophota bacterium]
MFCLTQEERGIIVFLAGMALLGLLVDYLSKNNLPLKSLVTLDENLGRININQADKEALLGLPGIGEKLAQRILDYRKESGGFNALEDLKNIKGITEYRYQKLKELIFLP